MIFKNIHNNKKLKHLWELIVCVKLQIKNNFTDQLFNI